MWCFKKRGKQAIGRSRGGLTTKIHTITASDRFAINFSLSSGAANDSPEGIKLLNLTPSKGTQIILMDRAYLGKKIREVAVKVVYKPVVPPKKNFKKRNEIERFFSASNVFVESVHVMINQMYFLRDLFFCEHYLVKVMSDRRFLLRVN